MSEAWIAFVGVVVGALLATWGQAVLAKRQRKWDVEDRDETRKHEQEGRVFESKRQAHVDFLASVERTESWIADWHTGVMDVPPPDYDSFEHLYGKLGQIHAFGSAESAICAADLVRTIAIWGTQTKDEYGASFEEKQAAKIAYLKAMRRDLGVDPA